jgi:hypothetical protein
MWCGKCYTSDPDVSFYIKRAVDDEGVVWKRRKETEHFASARNGDHVSCPFQCDLCIFRLLRKAEPDYQSASDRLLLACIRRANLDAFWSREKRTVEGNFNAMKRAMAASEIVGLSGGYPPPGPFPYEDVCGYEVAVQMLLGSKKPGKNDATYTQFDTIRRYRASFFNVWQVGQAAQGTLLASTDEKGTYSRLGSCPTQSLWFAKFMQGCKMRMGQLVIQDKAISVDLLLAVLGVVEGRIADADSLDDKAWWVSVGAYLTIGFCVSLRGPEGLMLDLGAVRSHLHKGKEDPNCPFVTIPLLGRFKGEDHHRQHLLFSVSETSSGFQPRKWLEALVAVRQKQQLTQGPAMCDESGYVVPQATINEAFRSCLDAVMEDAPELFPPGQKVSDYDIDRSLRRGSDSRAKALGVSLDDINGIHRWTKVEKAQGRKPAQSMSDRYADVEHLRPMFERYTRGL